MHGMHGIAITAVFFGATFFGGIASCRPRASAHACGARPNRTGPSVATHAHIHTSTTRHACPPQLWCRPPRIRSRTALPAARHATPRCAYASGSDSLCAAGRAPTAVSRTDADRRRACGWPRLRSEGVPAPGTAQAIRRDSTAHLASCGSLANGPTNRTKTVKRPLKNAKSSMPRLEFITMPRSRFCC